MIETESPKRCPLCHKPVSPAVSPFCSTRCATLDLGRWLGEKYVVPTEEKPDEAETAP